MALRVGLQLLTRTGDSALQKAAMRISAKIDALQTSDDRLHVAPWGVPMDDPDQGCVRSQPCATRSDPPGNCSSPIVGAMEPRPHEPSGRRR